MYVTRVTLSTQSHGLGASVPGPHVPLGAQGRKCLRSGDRVTDRHDMKPRKDHRRGAQGGRGAGLAGCSRGSGPASEATAPRVQRCDWQGGFLSCGIM